MYNNNGFIQNNIPTYDTKRAEKKELKKLGLFGGLSLLFFVAFQFLAVFILTFVGLSDKYLSDNNLTYALGTLISVFSIFVPFFIIWLCLNDKKKICLNFGKPYDSKLMLLAIPIGMMVCMAGNFITFYISYFFEEMFDIVFNSPETETPDTLLGIVAFILQVAFVPALVEEFAVRGVIMMPLRKYGNVFAILVSAAIFGIMHGNLVQAPFAFVVGAGIGYLVITTGTMWVGVIIHFINNLFSCVISLLYDYMSTESVNIIYYICVATFVVSGIICTFFFIRRATNNHIPISFKKPATTLSTGSKLVAYGINIPMIIAIAYLIYSTYLTVSHA